MTVLVGALEFWGDVIPEIWDLDLCESFPARDRIFRLKPIDSNSVNQILKATKKQLFIKSHGSQEKKNRKFLIAKRCLVKNETYKQTYFS